METKTFSIRPELLGKLETLVDRLNRRATRLGVEPVTLTKSPVSLRPVDVLDEQCERGISGIRIPRTIYVEFCDVTISLNIPKLADWSFVATIQHSEAGNLLLTVPQPETAPVLDLAEYYLCAPTCCHCNLERNRADTYLVRHTDGSLKQVGKQCLASFTGFGGTPEKAAALAEWLSDLTTLWEDPGAALDNDGGEGGGCGRGAGVSLNKFLAHVVAVSNKHGFRTRKQAEAQQTSSTKDDAIFNMEPPKTVRASKLIPVTPEDEAFALEARAWAAGLEVRGDFDHNLKVVASSDGVLYRNLGIAAYIVEGYRRHLGKVAELAARPVSVHFGEVGKRLRKLSLTYKGNHSFDSAYGVRFFHKFVTAEGNEVLWKTGSPAICSVGETIVVDATVKEHGEFKGRLQTELSRVKQVEK